ncbi:MAG: Xaa-Pro peptidase family protein, partial [Candidatus Diapherotrites archaeon]
MKEKIKELFDSTTAQQALFFNHNPSQPYFSYFTGLPLKQFEDSALALAKGKKPTIITTTLSQGLLENRKEFIEKTANNKKQFIETILKTLPEKKIGINFQEFSPASLARLKAIMKGKQLVNISKQLEKLRETKTESEKRKIASAVKITERALEKIPLLVKKGTSEKNLAKRIEIEMLENGADTTAFPPITASGKNARIPHYIPTEKKISKGFLIVDCGARFENYCADLSRTFFVGRASEKQKTLYELTFNAKKEAEKKAVLGAKASMLFNAVESVLAKQNFKMVHALGHGIGLQDHDFPRGISAKSTWKLEKGMCLA